MVGLRKIITAFILLLVGLGIVIYKGDIPPNFLTLLQTIFGAFVVGNAFEHYTIMRGEKGEIK